MFDAVAQFHLQRIEEFEIIVLVAGIDDGIGEFQSAFTALEPVVGLGATGTGGFGNLFHQGHFRIGIGVETVDADHRVDAGFADDADHVHHVFAAFFHQGQVFFGVGFIQGFAGNDLGAAAVHLQGADGGGQNGDMGFQAGEAAFDVPEFFKSDVSGKSGLGDMVIPQFQTHAVGDDGALAHGDVGEGAGMHQAGLIFGGAHEGGVDGVSHEGGHGVADFQVAGR